MSDSVADRPLLSWPRVLREVRAWLEPWILLQRYWRAWSAQPPPFPLQQLLDALCLGMPLFLNRVNKLPLQLFAIVLAYHLDGYLPYLQSRADGTTDVISKTV
jgi:hypothetical protein